MRLKFNVKMYRGKIVVEKRYRIDEYVKEVVEVKRYFEVGLTNNPFANCDD